MMREAILNFPKQFRFRPRIEGGKVKKYKKYVVCGMGGSPLPTLIIKSVRPELPIIIWRNYGLPELPDNEWKKTLVVAVSYSGGTEETIDALETAVSQNRPAAAIAIGNQLLEVARQHKVPYVRLPDTGISPRSGLGFSLLATLKLMKLADLLKEARSLSQLLKPAELEEQGKNLALKMKGRVPVIYASDRNLSVAYNWKIKFNETGKIPAFYNVFPELNHNEINGFDVREGSKAVTNWAYFIFLKDEQDHARIIKRMEVTERLYHQRGLPVEVLALEGQSRLERIFRSLLLADWTAYHSALIYGLSPEGQPMVDEFKRLIVDP